MSNEIRVMVRSKDTGEYSKEFRGKTYVYQNAYVFNGDEYPVKFQVNVEKGHEYDPGEYTIDPRSIRVDERQNLVFKGVKLLPLGGGKLGPK